MKSNKNKLQNCPRCRGNEISQSDYCLNCEHQITQIETNDFQIPLDLIPMANEIQKRIQKFFYIPTEAKWN